MKLSKLSKLIKGIKTDIGIIIIGSRIKFNDEYGDEDYGDFGTVVKIYKKAGMIKVNWDNNTKTEEDIEDLESFELIE